MFPFFKKKPIAVAVEAYEESRFAAGLEAATAKKTYKNDVRALQKKFYEARKDLRRRSDPSGTLVVFGQEDGDGRFRYFVGDLVDTADQPEGVTVKELPPGEYAEIHVKFSTPSGLAMSVARAKQFFMDKWLPGSGRRLRGGVESMELYDQRSNIQLPSIELMFPLEKNED